MPAPISIIIPTLNAARDLPACLDALIEGLHAGLIHELVICDGGSSDDTRALAQSAGARLIAAAPGRGGQLRRAVAQSRGTWLLILHADTVLAPGWSAHVATHIASSGRPACFFLQFRAPGLAARWTEGWANLRSRLFALPYGDQGLLVPRALYDAAGGYPPAPLMEDVALIRALGRPIFILRAQARTSAARYLAGGWLRRGAQNLTLLAAYFAGADPAKLAARYQKK